MAASSSSSESESEQPAKLPKVRRPITARESNKRIASALAARIAAAKAASPNPLQTPPRKPSAQQKTPASAPARAKKGGEPTLLGDFLLGRPSPQRQRAGGAAAPAVRRKTIDGKEREREMSMEEVGKVQQPGKVNERVKAWQKGSGGAGAGESPDVIVVEYETDSEVEVVTRQEKERARPAKRKPQKHAEEEERGRGVGMGAGEEERARSMSLAPKKRVISDSHWMKKKSPPRKGQGQGIPKGYVQATSMNPPVEKKIADWVQRTEVVEPEIQHVQQKPRSRSRKMEQNDGIRIKPERSASGDDGIRIKPSKDRPRKEEQQSTTSASTDDGIRVRPTREDSPQSDLRVKPIRKDGSKRRPKEDGESPTPTPRKKSEKHLLAPSENESRSRVSSHATTHHEDSDNHSWAPPSPRQRTRKSPTPTESMDEIPFGNSAFSVLDLPVGAEANTMRRPEPKRNPSFAVPKVLKKVYTEGKKMMQDAEPARGGMNQPPSIDSWLSGTVDPFVDAPAKEAEEAPKADVSRMRSYKEDDREKEIGVGQEEEIDTPRRKRRTRKSVEKDEIPLMPAPLELTTRDALPSMESPPNCPSGLRRSPATRNTSSPKSTRKISLKDAVFDAFKGESTMAKPAASPFDFIGLRERDVSREEYRPARELDPVAEDDPPKRSPRAFDAFEPARQSPALPSFPRRMAPTTGGHRLSTIASVETFTTSSATGTSSMTETDSELSRTTVTKGSELTQTTASSLSRGSKVSTSKRSTGNTTGLKRRLTKHSDLVSMLSLPDQELPGRGKSIKSARSIRTTKSHVETATVVDLMRELAEDETKYMRELNTLVDGVIPVLLTSVLSKSESAIEAGLFDPLASPKTGDASFTKPIVDMGVALERLKSMHKRIPLVDPEAFLRWAQSALKTYEDYLRAWRSGFEDVVVNLAPASRSNSLAEQSDSARMRIDRNGDVIRDTGERADVGYMLKRPLVRTKGLAKAAKGLARILDTKLADDTLDDYEQLETLRRKRVREEVARKEDHRANTTDASRARDPKTMAHITDVNIARHRSVYMKDIFAFEMIHSNGQHLECEVELTLRTVEASKTDMGDVLICQTDGTKYSLLFPPISCSNISARNGYTETELVLMIRGPDGHSEWRESFTLDAKEVEVAEEWLEKLGKSPVPPPIIHYKTKMDPKLETALDEAGDDTKSIVGALKSTVPKDIPLGERPRRAAEGEGGKPGYMDTVYRSLSEDRIWELSEYNVLDVKEVNDALRKAGKRHIVLLNHPTTPRQRPSRYHGPDVEVCNIPCVMLGALQPYPEEGKVDVVAAKKEKPASMSIEVPKFRAPSTPEKTSLPLRESMRPEPESMKRYHKKSPSRDEASPPPPPVHKTPSTPTLKTPPALDSPTPRGKNRRTSSPLKHEYQPSNASETSSSSEQSDSESDTNSYFSDESADELDDLEPELDTRPSSADSAMQKVTPPASIYNNRAASLAPSNSASQAPFSRPVSARPSTATRRIAAMVSCWSDKRGKWEDVYPDPCSVVVGPGRVECFDMSFTHSSPVIDGSDIDTPRKHNRDLDPLVGQDITPHVNLRQSTRIDIEISAPPSATSRMKGASLTLRYRTLSAQDCDALYAALHKARMENLKFKMMEQQRIVNAYGKNTAYENAVAGSRRNSLFRKQSYRRTSAETPIPAPQSVAGSEQSSLSSAISAVKRFGIGGIFNISKSSMQTSQGGPQSLSTSSSDYSGATPPHTRSPSLAASGSMWSTGVAVRDLGWQDLKIRLYVGLASNKWDDRGGARLTITSPPPGMRQASALDHGPEKRIVITQKPNGEGSEPIVLLDTVLGAKCFSMLGCRGVVATVWEDIRGDDGVVGQIGRVGGVSGRTRKWCFQTGRAGDCGWIYSLCRSGMV